MNDKSSYLIILRSSSIMGAASVINVLVSLLRMKAVAVMLGPAGVGLIGLFQSLIATASTVAALGLASAGTRQIAQANGSGRAEDIDAARRALFWGTFCLATIGGGVLFKLRDVIAAKMLQDPLRAMDVGWLSLGVVLTVASGYQSAILSGLRRIGDLARIQVAAGLLATVFGLVTLAIMREAGLALFVVSGPLASFLLGHWFVAKLGAVKGPATPLRVLLVQWSGLARLGAAFMVSALVSVGGQFAVRALVQRELGAEALGHFQGAWSISMTYLGFVLSAMATDYYPRLAASISDQNTATRLVNEQTEVALLLSGPVLLAMMGLAPWIIPLFYSSDFAPAVEILRWQLMGDALKLASWPLGFVLVASGAGKTFLLTESFSMSIFVCATWLLLPVLGVTATGVAFLAMYLSYLPVVYWLARRQIGFRWWRLTCVYFTVLFGAALAVDAACRISPATGAMIGVPIACCFAAMGLKLMASKIDRFGLFDAIGRMREKLKRET